LLTDVLNRILHILLAIPSVHKNSLTVTISTKLSKVVEKIAAHSSISAEPSGRPTGSDAGSNAGSARGRTVEVGEPREPVEDLV
jgi:hypothetical protein